MYISATEINNNNKARTIMKNETLLNIIEASESSKEAQAFNVNPIDALQIVNFTGIKYTLVNGDNKISHNDSRIDKLLFVLRIADQAQVIYDLKKDLVKILVNEYIKFGFSHINVIINDNLPINQKAMFEEDGYLSRLLTEEVLALYSHKEKVVANHIGTKRSSYKINMNNGTIDAVEAMIRQGGIFAFNAGMGTGKTENVTKPAFDLACELNQKPIGISPKRILSSAICNDERHYVGHTSDKGLFGVINTVIASPRFKGHREACNVLICEEHEENVSQATGKAVGKGSINERSELLDGYYSLMATSRTVLIMDATLSEDQVKVIEAKTGRKVHVITSDSVNTKQKTVKLLSESENVARASRAILNNKNVVNFSDASNRGEKSKFNEIYHALANKSSTQVTANSISELSNKEAFIANIESELSKFQYAQISPVINSGVSLHNGHFNSVHVMLNEVIPVKSAIQTCGRVRDAEVINLSVSKSMSVKNTSVNAIIANEMINDKTISEVSDDLYKSYTSNSSVITMAEIIAKENMMRIDYESNLIIALRLMGYKVEIDTDDIEKGQEIKKAGREIEAEERIQSIINAEDVTDEVYKGMSEAQYTTNAQKFAIAKHEMKNTYVGMEVNEELIAFDKKGERRSLIENNMLATNHTVPKSKKAALKKNVIDFLFSTLEVDATSFTGKYSKVQADAIVNKFLKGTFAVSEYKKFENGKLNTCEYNISGTKAFEMAFNTRLPSGHSTTVVSRILAKFGIKQEKVGQQTVNGKRVNVYQVSPELMNEAVLETITTVRANIEEKNPALAK